MRYLIATNGPELLPIWRINSLPIGIETTPQPKAWEFPACTLCVVSKRPWITIPLVLGVPWHPRHCPDDVANPKKEGVVFALTAWFGQRCSQGEHQKGKSGGIGNRQGGQKP